MFVVSKESAFYRHSKYKIMLSPELKTAYGIKYDLKTM